MPGVDLWMGDKYVPFSECLFINIIEKQDNNFSNMTIYFLICIQYEQFCVIKREFNLTKVSVDIDM